MVLDLLKIVKLFLLISSSSIAFLSAQTLLPIDLDFKFGTTLFQ